MKEKIPQGKKRYPNHNSQFKEQISVWDDFYTQQVQSIYQYTPKDFANLKWLLIKCDNVDIGFNDFLCSITSSWHLQNLSIPLLNSHFNQLIANCAKKSQYPDHYSRKFEQTLEQDQLPAYWQHLTALGFKKGYSQGAGSIWIK